MGRLVSFDKPIRIAATQIKERADFLRERRLGSPTIFGRDRQTGRWTYALAGGAPETFAELKIAWSYFASWEESAHLEAQDFELRIESVIEFARHSPLLR